MCAYYKNNVKLHQRNMHGVKTCRIIGIGCENCKDNSVHQKCRLPVNENNPFRRKRKWLTADDLDDEKTLLKCTTCDFKTRISKNMLEHKQSVHLEGKRFACVACTYKSFYKQNVKNHIKYHHKSLEISSIVNLTCKDCDNDVLHECVFRKETGKGSTLTRKSRQEGDRNKKECNICHNVSINSSELRKHFKKCHKDKSIFKCEFCEYGSNWRSNIKTHKEAKHLGLVNKCDKCDYESIWNPRFLQHRRESHGIFVKQTKNKALSDFKEILCDECGFIAKFGGNLAEHRKKDHVNERSHKCSDCEYSSNVKCNLRQHVESKHSGVRYECQECEYKATTQGNLKVHSRIKHSSKSSTKGKKKFSCTKCEFSSNVKCNLQAHTQIIHEKVRYPCQECPYQSTTKGNLKIHVKLKHTINVHDKLQ